MKRYQYNSKNVFNWVLRGVGVVLLAVGGILVAFSVAILRAHRAPIDWRLLAVILPLTIITCFFGLRLVWKAGDERASLMPRLGWYLLGAWFLGIQTMLMMVWLRERTAPSGRGILNAGIIGVFCIVMGAHWRAFQGMKGSNQTSEPYSSSRGGSS